MTKNEALNWLWDRVQVSSKECDHVTVESRTVMHGRGVYQEKNAYIIMKNRAGRFRAVGDTYKEAAEKCLAKYLRG